jgi:hypothetical protein
MKKYIQILSDGSLTFFLDKGIHLKKIKISDKDHKNFFLKTSTTNLHVNMSNSSSKYKNKYF